VHDELLARHSTWRCGGHAAHYFEPADLDDLSAFMPHIAHDPLTWLGLGSNVLVRDGGVSGTVIATAAHLTRHRWTSPRTVKVEAGLACARLARMAAHADRGGLEFLAGIPGSVGGALYMNAGALGSEIWQFVTHVELMTRDGRIERFPANAFEVGYRHVTLPVAGWFVAAELELPAIAAGAGMERIRAVLAQRNATQPTGQATCGSVFKNPVGDYAGRLIEQCGLKGYRIGGCHVSTVHANFIVNDLHANASEIESLIACVQGEVKRQTGVALEPEVRIIGARSEVGA
jgi:UDP-N-acetylmuramate dehydrogenase